MTREPFKDLRSRALLLPEHDIDTDQIIPARFLTTTERKGLGRHAFADWRKGRNSALDDPAGAGCQILITGRNYGCGSSREHAPWALLDLGFRAVISTSFADIFRQNAHKNGSLTLVLDEADHRELSASIWPELFIDLPVGLLIAQGGRSFPFELDPHTRYCFLEGLDELDLLLSLDPLISDYEKGAAS